jgi:RNA polymerase sigma factor (TIGR02999 family)
MDAPDQVGAVSHDDASAAFVEFYGELRRMAQAFLRDGASPTLQATALVHEVFVKVAGLSKPPVFASKKEFFVFSARSMRSVILDRARARAALKRVLKDEDPLLTVLVPAERGRPEEIIQFDELITLLGRYDGRQARTMELRFYMGLTVREIAKALDVSPATVKRDIDFATRWIRTRMEEKHGDRRTRT